MQTRTLKIKEVHLSNPGDPYATALPHGRSVLSRIHCRADRAFHRVSPGACLPSLAFTPIYTGIFIFKRVSCVRVYCHALNKIGPSLKQLTTFIQFSNHAFPLVGQVIQYFHVKDHILVTLREAKLNRSVQPLNRFRLPFHTFLSFLARDDKIEATSINYIININASSSNSPSQTPRGFFINMPGITHKKQSTSNQIHNMHKAAFTDDSPFNVRYDYYHNLSREIAFVSM